jgi:hypothetical protein
MKASGIKPQWHGDDLSAARIRADQIGGVVVWSAPPEENLLCNKMFWGYWSDKRDTFIRDHAGERIIKKGQS